MEKAQSDILCRIIVAIAIPNVIVERYNNKGNVTAIRFYTKAAAAATARSNTSCLATSTR